MIDFSSHPLSLLGVGFLVLLLAIIGVAIGKGVFKDEPIFIVPIVIGEMLLAFYAFSSPWLLTILGCLLTAILLFATFASSLLLGMETLLLGIPGIVLFAFSLLNPENTLFQAAAAVLFFIGILADELLREVALELLQGLAALFLFSLAIVAVFLIPAVLPWLSAVDQLAALAGLIAGIAWRLYIRNKEHQALT